MRLKYRKALTRRQRRHVRVRARVSGTTQRPRLCVFRSSAHIYAQVIDDLRGHTLVAASDIEEAVRDRAGNKATKSERAQIVGELVAEREKEVGIEKVVFDRGGFLFHGRVKAVAEGARSVGLQF
ncbi:50S ribosomal protein L18 [soil metagenome]